MTITEALYSLRSSRTFMSFKDIRENEYHVETAHENDVDFLYMTSNTYGEKRILEKLRCLSSCPYVTTIHLIENNFIIRLTSIDKSSYMLWRDRLGYPGRNTMLRIMNASHGHPLGGKILVINLKSPCQACSILKINLKQIHVNPTTLVSKFSLRESKVILVDLSNQYADRLNISWFWLMHRHDGHNCIYCPQEMLLLLNSSPRRLDHHLDYLIKSRRLNNTKEFTSKFFYDFCMSLGI